MEHRRREEGLLIALDSLGEPQRAPEEVGAVAVLDDRRFELRAGLDDLPRERRVGRCHL